MIEENFKVKKGDVFSVWALLLMSPKELKTCLKIIFDEDTEEEAIIKARQEIMSDLEYSEEEAKEFKCITTAKAEINVSQVIDNIRPPQPLSFVVAEEYNKEKEEIKSKNVDSFVCSIKLLKDKFAKTKDEKKLLDKMIIRVSKPVDNFQKDYTRK